MTVWTATYYLPLDGRGDDILDELDREMDVSPGSNRVERGRAYFDVEVSPEELDAMLEEIDGECWEHLRKLER